MKKLKPKILLTSVFKPYCVDNRFSRKLNPMECSHNQITREQGVFSLRTFQFSYGLYMIAANINAETTVLDFPTLNKFENELKRETYDYVGISFIVPNFLKAKKMAETVRLLSPQSKIVLGGHGTQIEDIGSMIESDYIVRGEGIRWFRALLGDPIDYPTKHPFIRTAFNERYLGLPFSTKSAVVIPGVGCWNACNFCSTSHFFKKQHLHFFGTGKTIFNIMNEIEEQRKVSTFFIMDENFLKNKERFLELGGEIERAKKAWELTIFASAEALMQYDLDWLAKIGVSTIWMGVESKFSIYPKNRSVDFKKLAEELHKRGIVTIFSSILFLDCHNKNNIFEDIDFTLSLKPDLTQFMIYIPAPGTDLYSEKKRKNELLNVPYEDRHGQYQICHKHPNFSLLESERILVDAFKKDYHELGPSIYRVFAKCLLKYSFIKNSGKIDPIMLTRMKQARRSLCVYSPALLAMEFFAPNRTVKMKMKMLRKNINKEIGVFKSLLFLPLSLVVFLSLSITFFRYNVLKTSIEPRTSKAKYGTDH